MKEYLVWVLVDVSRRLPPEPDDETPWDEYFEYESTIEITRNIREDSPARAILSVFWSIKDVSKEDDLAYTIIECMAFDIARKGQRGKAFAAALNSIK
jgi:hypothetical protein